MAAQTPVVGSVRLPAKGTAVDDRRRETRFGAEGQITILVSDGPHPQELVAELMDFSLRGLRVRLAIELPQGQQVRVFFSWGEVATQVMWTSAVPEGFDIGLQLF